MITSYEELLDQNRAEEIWLTRLLLELGMPQHLKGFKCAVTVIILCMKNSGYLDATTTELYPAAARILGTTSAGVERALRNAIEIAWLYGDTEFQHDIFGRSVSSSRGQPTNAAFIHTLYYKMRRELVVCGKRDISKDIGFFPIG